MFVTRLSFHNQSTNWHLPEVDLSQFCLFVGLSGAGKSRILQALSSIKELLNGRTGALSGCNFDIHFQADGHNYRWSAELSSVGAGVPDVWLKRQSFMLKNRPAFIEEQIERDGQLLFSRSGTSCGAAGLPVEGLSPHLSLTQLFEDHADIRKLRAAFQRLFTMDFYFDKAVLCDIGFLRGLLASDPDVTESMLQSSRLSPITKLAYLHEAARPEFEQIRDKFIEIFPYVTDIAFREAYENHQHVLCIKEPLSEWIVQSDLSSGMFKTLMFLTQLYLLPGNCVVLVDEIENSLGLNCLDLLQEQLDHSTFDNQLLVTSHHPFIINSVDMEHWRVVSRQGGVVVVRTAAQLGLGHSSLDGFMQLINSLEYSEGIQP